MIKIIYKKYKIYPLFKGKNKNKIEFLLNLKKKKIEIYKYKLNKMRKELNLKSILCQFMRIFKFRFKKCRTSIHSISYSKESEEEPIIVCDGQVLGIMRLQEMSKFN